MKKVTVRRILEGVTGRGTGSGVKKGEEIVMGVIMRREEMGEGEILSKEMLENQAEIE